MEQAFLSLSKALQTRRPWLLVALHVIMAWEHIGHDRAAADTRTNSPYYIDDIMMQLRYEGNILDKSHLKHARELSTTPQEAAVCNCCNCLTTCIYTCPEGASLHSDLVFTEMRAKCFLWDFSKRYMYAYQCISFLLLCANPDKVPLSER